MLIPRGFYLPFSICLYREGNKVIDIFVKFELNMGYFLYGHNFIFKSISHIHKNQ
jgi:hypothetical protein